ncbi:ECF transporter S component [Pseudolactococcus yaeyamensis]
MKIKRITFGALFLSLSLLIPQVFHQIGYSQAGATLLPMHLPIFLCGLLLGGVYGGFVGAVAPVLSFLLTGMPPLTVMVFMSVELAVYGLVSALCLQQRLTEKTYGIWLALLLAMLAGRIAKMIAIFFALHLFGISVGGVATVVTATITGIPGILLQLLVIPMVVMKLERSGYFYGHEKVDERI